MPTPSEQFLKPKTRGANVRLPMAVDPARIRLAWKAAETGNPDKLFAVLEHFMKVDDEIKSATQSLHAAVLSGGVTVKPREDAGAEAATQAEFFTALFEELDFDNMLRELMLAEYYGFKAVVFPAEAWGTMTVDGRTYQAPLTYELLPLSWIYAKKEQRNDDYNTIHVGDRPYHDYQDGSIILATERKLPSYEDIDFTRFGHGVACMRFAGFKYFDYEDWAAFNETFATPLILGKTGPSGQQEVVKKAVQEMANDARAVVGENDDITFPESNKTSSVSAYEKFADKIDKVIAKIIKSESLTDNMGKYGSYSAMTTTNGVRLDVAQTLGKKITRLVRRKIMMPIADWNFNGRLLCDFSLNVKGNTDMTQQIKVDERMSRMMEGSENHLRKKYNFPAPKDDEDTVRRSTGGTLLGG